MTTLALLSPGAMGASVGAAAVSNGNKVTWLDHQRSERTRTRAHKAGLIPVKDEAIFFREADIVLSICPPHSANAVAEQVITSGFNGLFLEGNAISPKRSRQICSTLSAQGIQCVDGGIIGGPAWSESSHTKLYLSGSHADAIADLFESTPLSTQIIAGDIGHASALKMVFAAYSKGTTALVAAILATAKQEGVLEALQNQWGQDFSEQASRQVTHSAKKAWRFSGEMDEIAETFASAGLPPGFHLAASEVFARLDDFKDVETPPTLNDYLARLTQT